MEEINHYISIFIKKYLNKNIKIHHILNKI
jgi:hypothetical protein